MRSSGSSSLRGGLLARPPVLTLTLILVLTLLLVLPLLAAAPSVSADRSSPPPNDELEKATAITALPFRDRLDASGATGAPDDPACVYRNEEPTPNVWYALTLADETRVELSTAGSTTDTTLCVYLDDLGQLTEIASNDMYGGLQSRILLVAGAHTTYLILVQTPHGGDPALTFEATARPELVPPRNNDIPMATAITTLPFTDEVDLTVATHTPVEPACVVDGLGPDVWYALTLPEDTLVQAGTEGATFATVVAAYPDPPDGTTVVACDDWRTEADGGVRFAADAGVTYLLRIGGARNYLQDSPFRVHVASRTRGPRNDDRDQATPITALPFTDQLSTSEATRAADDPDVEGAGATVWYALTLAKASRVEVSTYGSSYDTTLSAYLTDGDDLRQIAHDAGGGRQDPEDQGIASQIVFDADTDTTYLVMVGALGNGTGGGLQLEAVERPAVLDAADDGPTARSIALLTGVGVVLALSISVTFWRRRHLRRDHPRAGATTT